MPDKFLVRYKCKQSVEIDVNYEVYSGFTTVHCFSGFLCFYTFSSMLHHLSSKSFNKL